MRHRRDAVPSPTGHRASSATTAAIQKAAHCSPEMLAVRQFVLKVAACSRPPRHLRDSGELSKFDPSACAAAGRLFLLLQGIARYQETAGWSAGDNAALARKAEKARPQTQSLRLHCYISDRAHGMQ